MTGSGGFIGSHLVSAIAGASDARAFPADVTDQALMKEIAQTESVHTVVHMAAAGTVLVDLDAIPRMVDVSLGGLINAMRVFQPARVVYASSCSVYGSTPVEGAYPDWESIRPLGAYGSSKALTEKALDQWARQTNSQAVILRIGNVVGAGCQGLISYLVRHAVRYPDGSVPAEMRGAGEIARDYVPVGYAVSVVRNALQADYPEGSASIFNVGSGRTMTNGEVAAIVASWLESQGFQLNIQFRPHPDPVEAPYCRLITTATESAFHLAPPPKEQVREAIIGGARFVLETLTRRDRSFAAAAS